VKDPRSLKAYEFKKWGRVEPTEVDAYVNTYQYAPAYIDINIQTTPGIILPLKGWEECVCMSVRSYFRNYADDFTKYSVHVDWPCLSPPQGGITLRCVICTSGFVDDVTFSHWPCGAFLRGERIATADNRRTASIPGPTKDQVGLLIVDCAQGEGSKIV